MTRNFSRAVKETDENKVHQLANMESEHLLTGEQKFIDNFSKLPLSLNIR